MNVRFDKYLISLAAVLGFTLSACDDCSDMDMRATAPISFSIVDDDGNDLLASSKARYSVDSIRLFDNDSQKSIVVTNVYFPGLKSYVFYADCDKNGQGKSSLRLQFNSVDSDTLEVWYEQEKNACANVYKYTQFRHNGESVKKSPLTSALLIVKAK
ncbi:hypothetical protein [Dyadobacter sp. 676]|uniref:Lipoprotein n=1 Tax=Dyadobacter sp. 676 TaxID=3088362 RepID=A0AAU8FJ31_9BACT